MAVELKHAQWRPVLPTAPFMSAAWKPVSVTMQWSLEGGYLTKLISLETKQILTASGAQDFVKIEMNPKWLLKAVIGKGLSAKGGSAKVDTLQFHEKQIGREGVWPAVAGEP